LEEDTELIKHNILEKGYSLIIGIYDCDIVLANKIIENKELNKEFNTSSVKFYN
jgi:hypothetical protein